MAEPCSSRKLGRRSGGEAARVLATAAAVAAAADAAATIAMAASASATASALASAAAAAAASASASASSRSDSDERREKVRSLSPREPTPNWARGATWDLGAGEGRVEASAGVSESCHSWASTASPPPVVPPSLPPKSSMVSCALPAGSATWLGFGVRVQSKG